NLLADVGQEVVVILSTHIVDDVRELCQNMAIMNLGKIVYAGTPGAVLDELKGKVWMRVVERDEVDTYRSTHHVISDKMVAGRPQIHVLSDTNPGDGFTAVEPSLEDVFFVKITPGITA
ncbi:MAG: ABC transporter ATP-binding protein, partial [Flavobacteriales bacterium]|nr:ABC transporter ATP-binding protein [Flavobacteriales bacterium]